MRFNKHNVYTIRIPASPGCGRIVGGYRAFTGVTARGAGGGALLPQGISRRSGHLPGVVDQSRKNYHLEIVTDSFQQAAVIQSLMETFS